MMRSNPDGGTRRVRPGAVDAGGGGYATTGFGGGGGALGAATGENAGLGQSDPAGYGDVTQANESVLEHGRANLANLQAGAPKPPPRPPGPVSPFRGGGSGEMSQYDYYTNWKPQHEGQLKLAAKQRGEAADKAKFEAKVGEDVSNLVNATHMWPDGGEPAGADRPNQVAADTRQAWERNSSSGAALAAPLGALFGLPGYGEIAGALGANGLPAGHIPLPWEQTPGTGTGYNPNAKTPEELAWEQAAKDAANSKPPPFPEGP